MSDQNTFLASAEDVAKSLLGEHGATAQNIAARKLVDAIKRGDTQDWKQWLQVRECIISLGDAARYTRRLSDKLLWTIEQTLQSDMPHLASLLAVILQDALDAEEKAKNEARTDAPQKRPPLGGGVDTDVPEYTRRLSDKLIWALQQAVAQGQMEIARSLKPIYEVALEGEAVRAQEYMTRNG